MPVARAHTGRWNAATPQRKSSEGQAVAQAALMRRHNSETGHPSQRLHGRNEPSSTSLLARRRAWLRPAAGSSCNPVDGRRRHVRIASPSSPPVAGHAPTWASWRTLSRWSNWLPAAGRPERLVPGSHSSPTRPPLCRPPAGGGPWPRPTAPDTLSTSGVVLSRAGPSSGWAAATRRGPTPGPGCGRGRLRAANGTSSTWQTVPSGHTVSGPGSG